MNTESEESDTDDTSHRVSGVSVCQMVYGGMVGTPIYYTRTTRVPLHVPTGGYLYTYVCVSWLVFLHDVGS